MSRGQFFRRRVERENLRQHSQFAQPASDELGVLGAEIENE
jgi:hypothetical protein